MVELKKGVKKSLAVQGYQLPGHDMRQRHVGLQERSTILMV